MAGQIKSTTVKNIVQNLNVDTLIANDHSYQTYGVIEDISDLMGYEEPRLNQGYNLLKENNINYKKDDIKLVKKNEDQIMVEMKNGEQFIFNLEDSSLFSEKFVLSEVKLDDGTKIKCNLSESEQNEIIEKAGLIGNIDSQINIKGYTIVDVGDQKIKVYWTGDSTEFIDYEEKLNLIKKGLNKYPKNVLNEVLDSIDFKGFFISTSNTLNYDKETMGHTQSTNYIYINAENNSEFAIDTIEHEFAHLIDSVWYEKLTGKQGGVGYEGSSESYIYPDKTDGGKFKSLFDKYHILLTKIDNGAYRTGTESPGEFFAQATSIYLEHPNKLKNDFPDLYQYIEDFLKNFK